MIEINFAHADLGAGREVLDVADEQHRLVVAHRLQHLVALHLELSAALLVREVLRVAADAHALLVAVDAVDLQRESSLCTLQL